jgi:hypothetical protein
MLLYEITWNAKIPGKTKNRILKKWITAASTLG